MTKTDLHRLVDKLPEDAVEGASLLIRRVLLRQLDPSQAWVGQFLNYRLALEAQEPQRQLYLAVPVDTYMSFFSLPFTEASVQHYELRIVVYDPNEETIVQWKS